MKTLIVLITVFLTGCASQCKSHCVFGVFGPGNSAFDAIGHMYNKDDPCQFIGKPEGYKLADFCFANAGKRVYYVRDVQNRIVYTVR